MPEQTAPEPSMDEILASIRRIISEEAPVSDEAGPSLSSTEQFRPATVHEPAHEPAQEKAHVEAQEPASEPEPVLHQPYTANESEPKPTPMSETNPETVAEEPLVGEKTALAAGSAFDDLAASADEAARALHKPAPRSPGRSIEDLATDLLRPLLKEWLDANLADIVRARVDEEVARIARSRVR